MSCASEDYSWVLSAMQKHLGPQINATVELDGTSQNGDGYMGNITYLKISNKNSKSTLYIVLKTAHHNSMLRKQMPVRGCFVKEILLYTKIQDAFNNFLKSLKIQETLNIMPKCFATDLTEPREMLILENLKVTQYQLWDRTKAMNRAHVEICLKAYARWHALSFALKTRQRHVFDQLVENNVNMYSQLMLHSKFNTFLELYLANCKQNLIENGMEEIANIVNFTAKEIEYALIDMFFEEPESHVILHGDCWANNLFFKYNNDGHPTDLRIIDWQASGLASPVFDLSFFLYACCDFHEFADAETLLTIYFDELKNSLSQFDCGEVVEDGGIFSYEKFREHWRRFARYGFILNLGVLQLSLCDADEAPDFASNAEKGLDFIENFKQFRIRREDEYLRRARDNFLHYAQTAL